MTIGLMLLLGRAGVNIVTPCSALQFGCAPFRTSTVQVVADVVVHYVSELAGQIKEAELCIRFERLLPRGTDWISDAISNYAVSLGRRTDICIKGRSTVTFNDTCSQFSASYSTLVLWRA